MGDRDEYLFQQVYAPQPVVVEGRIRVQKCTHTDPQERQ